MNLSLKIIKYINSFPFFWIYGMRKRKLSENRWIRARCDTIFRLICPVVPVFINTIMKIHQSCSRSLVSIFSRSSTLLNIERLLWIAEMYVLNVEETHHSPRTILPHGASFQGYQINLFVSSEAPKHEFMLVVRYPSCQKTCPRVLSEKLARVLNFLNIKTTDCSI